jgi:hypothetical protein
LLETDATHAVLFWAAIAGFDTCQLMSESPDRLHVIYMAWSHRSRPFSFAPALAKCDKHGQINAQ